MNKWRESKNKKPIFGEFLAFNTCMVLRKKKHDKSIGVIRMMGEGDQTFRGAEDYNDIDLADLDFFPSTILTCSEDKTVKLFDPEIKEV